MNTNYNSPQVPIPDTSQSSSRGQEGLLLPSITSHPLYTQHCIGAEIGDLPSSELVQATSGVSGRVNSSLAFSLSHQHPTQPVSHRLLIAHFWGLSYFLPWVPLIYPQNYLWSVPIKASIVFQLSTDVGSHFGISPLLDNGDGFPTGSIPYPKVPQVLGWL